MFYHHFSHTGATKRIKNITRQILIASLTKGGVQVQNEFKISNNLHTKIIKRFGISIKNKTKTYKLNKPTFELKPIDFLKMDRSISWHNKEKLYKTIHKLGYQTITHALWDLYQTHPCKEIEVIFNSSTQWPTNILKKLGFPLRNSTEKMNSRTKRILKNLKQTEKRTMFYFHYNQYMNRNLPSQISRQILHLTTTMNHIDIVAEMKGQIGFSNITTLTKNYGMSTHGKTKPYIPKGNPKDYKMIEFLKMDRSVNWDYKKDLYATINKLGFESITHAMWTLYQTKESSEIAILLDRTKTWVTVILGKFNFPIKSKGGSRKKAPKIAGKTFGKIKVIDEIDMDKPGKWYLCNCLYCGEIIEMSSTAILKSPKGCINCRHKRAAITCTRSIIGI